MIITPDIIIYWIICGAVVLIVLALTARYDSTHKED